MKDEVELDNKIVNAGTTFKLFFDLVYHSIIVPFIVEKSDHEVAPWKSSIREILWSVCRSLQAKSGLLPT